MTALLILFAGLNALDAVLTYKILRRGGRELMPVASGLIERIGLYNALLVLKLATIAGVWWWAFNGLDARILAGMCAIFAGIVAWNYNQYRKQN